MAICPERLDFISICTGGGGLDLGVELAVPGSRSVCMVEREAFGAARLVSAMEDGLLAPAPVWSDARTFNGRRWRGCVDGLIGGIPCQPHSVAGKRRGSADARDLWSAARRIVVQSGAWFVLIENVPGMLSSSDPDLRSGGERVWRDLQRLGFAVEGGLFSAAEVGAPHERERIFILGVAERHRCHDDGRRICWTGWGRQSSDSSEELADACRAGHQGRELGRASGEIVGLAAPGSASELRGALLGNANGVREQQSHDQDGPEPWENARDRAGGPGLRSVGAMGDAGRGGRAGRTEGAVGRPIDRASSERAGGPAGRALADTDCAGPSSLAGNLGQVRGLSEGQRQSGHGAALPGGGGDQPRAPLWPPRPNDLDGWRDLLAVRPEVEPAVRGDAHGVASRVDELRMLGNGVVPLEAAHALRTLAVRLSARSAAATRLVRMMNAPERQDERSAA